MIAYLKGNIVKKTNKGIILNVKDVGYFVHLTNAFLNELYENDEIELFIYSHVKEDAMDLYGFTSYSDLTFFKNLISINGIGPKVAMEVMNTPQEKISSAIINEDEAFICKIPGIGKKTAKRLIMELKDKIEMDFNEEKSYRSHSEDMLNESFEALLKLGYQRHEIKNFINSLPEEIQATEEIVTYFLKNR